MPVAIKDTGVSAREREDEDEIGECPDRAADVCQCSDKHHAPVSMETLPVLMKTLHPFPIRYLEDGLLCLQLSRI